MTRRIAHMVTRNEAGRYLPLVLRELTALFDCVAVYDDRSDDGTTDLLAAAGAAYAVRPEGEPSFLENEGAFRQAAWNWMAEAVGASPGDIVACVDADEIFVDNPVAALYEASLDPGWEGLILPIVETFGWARTSSGVVPLVRTDGEWGRITGCRVVRYAPDQKFAREKMACGSVPTTRAARRHWGGLRLLHLGYATEEDQRAKHQRYSAAPGHSAAHVRSILGPKTLEPFADVLFGEVPGG